MSIPSCHLVGPVVEGKQLCVYCDVAIYDANASDECFTLPVGGWPQGTVVWINGTGNGRTTDPRSGWHCRVWSMMPWEGRPLNAEERALVDKIMAMSVAEYREWRRRA